MKFKQRLLLLSLASSMISGVSAAFPAYAETPVAEEEINLNEEELNSEEQFNLASAESQHGLGDVCISMEEELAYFSKFDNTDSVSYESIQPSSSVESITSKDSEILQNFLANTVRFSDLQYRLGDCDQDGQISISDAIWILSNQS